jgi:voltage-gated potassium channel
MTTVGYGDVTPLSDSGKAVTLLMILTGVLLIPWQFGELIKQLIKNRNLVENECARCGLSRHDSDAMFCKKCGTVLKKTTEIINN